MLCRLVEKYSEKYYGKYIAIPSFTDKKVITYNEEIVKVYNESVKKGYKDFVIIYIPKPDERFIFP